MFCDKSFEYKRVQPICFLPESHMILVNLQSPVGYIFSVLLSMEMVRGGGGGGALVSVTFLK